MRKYFLREDGMIASMAIPEDHQINREVEKKIRERYSINDELKARRVGGSFATEVDTYIDECIAWGDEQKAAVALDREAIQLDNLESAETELMALNKTDLIAYAERIGFTEVTGTKQEIADMILIAVGLK